MDVEGKFAGEIRIEPIKYSKIMTKVVTRNNKFSGKITVPLEHIDEQVYVLFQKKKKGT